VQDDASISWRKRKKHFFMLSHSGKPIYSRFVPNVHIRKYTILIHSDANNNSVIYHLLFQCLLSWSNSLIYLQIWRWTQASRIFSYTAGHNFIRGEWVHGWTCELSFFSMNILWIAINLKSILLRTLIDLFIICLSGGIVSNWLGQENTRFVYMLSYGLKKIFLFFMF
jgi:hypothetical protein